MTPVPTPVPFNDPAMNGGSNARCLMRLSSVWEPGSCTDGFQVDGANLQVDIQVWHQMHQRGNRAAFELLF